MGEWLSKEPTLFERDEQGKIIPKKITLESVEGKPAILATPLPRGKLQKIYQKAKNGLTEETDDEQIIVEHCLEPKYTLEEVKFLKPLIAGAIVTAILSISTGVSQEEMQEKATKQAIEISEEYLKKK